MCRIINDENELQMWLGSALVRGVAVFVAGGGGGGGSSR